MNGERCLCGEPVYREWPDYLARNFFGALAKACSGCGRDLNDEDELIASTIEQGNPYEGLVNCGTCMTPSTHNVAEKRA